MDPTAAVNPGMTSNHDAVLRKQVPKIYVPPVKLKCSPA